MALMNYKSVLTTCKDKIKETMAVLRAREMEKNGELEICKIEAKIAEHEQKVQELAAQYPIDFYRLINCMDELALLERKKFQFEKVINELFVEPVTK